MTTQSTCVDPSLKVGLIAWADAAWLHSVKNFTVHFHATRVRDFEYRYK